MLSYLPLKTIFSEYTLSKNAKAISHNQNC